MNEILEYKIKYSKISKMKKPTILMNSDDLKTFENNLKEKIVGFSLGTNPKYRNIPIETRDFLEHNQIIIYDADFNLF